jgi:mono/diheme cytochrome c family protein
VGALTLAVSLRVASCVALAILALKVRDVRGAAEPSPERLAEGRAIYVKFCAVCHGMKLEGQPDWQSRLPSGKLPAPPHDASGHTWHHPMSMLFRITKEGASAVVGGGYRSDMAGFGRILSDDQIMATLEYIRSTWPERERALSRIRGRPRFLRAASSRSRPT